MSVLITATLNHVFQASSFPGLAIGLASTDKSLVSAKILPELEGIRSAVTIGCRFLFLAHNERAAVEPVKLSLPCLQCNPRRLPQFILHALACSQQIDTSAVDLVRILVIAKNVNWHTLPVIWSALNHSTFDSYTATCETYRDENERLAASLRTLRMSNSQIEAKNVQLVATMLAFSQEYLSLNLDNPLTTRSEYQQLRRTFTQSRDLLKRYTRTLEEIQREWNDTKRLS
jgi:hypothetical protein